MGAGVGSRGNAALLLSEGAVVLESGRITKATEALGRDLGRCASFVANGGKWCLSAGTLPAGNSGEARGRGLELWLGKKADIKDGSRRLYFVCLVLGHISLPQLVQRLVLGCIQ